MPTGVPGNAYNISAAKQTVKGTPNATSTLRLKVTGGDVSPVRSLITLAETDSSAQVGQNVAVGGSVTGSTTHYLRPDEFGSIAYWTMGANVDSGSTPNYTHTATGATATPYVTLIKNYNSTTLVDQYSDCRISSLTVAGSAGGALTYAPTWQGLTYLLGQTDSAATASTMTPLTYPQVTVSKGGSDPGTVDSFSITINRGGGFVAGDSGLSQVDYVLGLLEVTGTMSLLFASDADYRAFYGGATNATTPGVTLFSEALTLTATANANLSVAFTMTAVQYTSYPLAPDPSGAPIRVAMGFRAVPQTSIASTLSIVTKNQTASV